MPDGQRKSGKKMNEAAEIAQAEGAPADSSFADDMDRLCNWCFANLPETLIPHLKDEDRDAALQFARIVAQWTSAVEINLVKDGRRDVIPSVVIVGGWADDFVMQLEPEKLH